MDVGQCILYTGHCGLFDVFANMESPEFVRSPEFILAKFRLRMNDIERICCEFGSQLSVVSVKRNVTCERQRFDIAAPKSLAIFFIYSTFCSLLIHPIDVWHVALRLQTDTIFRQF